MSVGIQSNIDDIQRSLSDVARRQLPFALSVALNETGETLLESNRRHIARAFDRPTRWTVNAFRLVRATKSRPTVTIQRKTAAAARDYLETQEVGGARADTGRERRLASDLPNAGPIGQVAPTSGATLDRHGNITRARWSRLVADAARPAGGGGRRGGGRHFAARPGQLSPGIWLRRGGALTKVVNFAIRAPRYRPRLQFDDRLNRLGARLFPARFAAALARAIATAR